MLDKKSPQFSRKQIIFQQLFMGTLIYAVVLGLFNDYTEVVNAKSFSTILFSSVVLEILTFIAFELKGLIVEKLKSKNGVGYKALMFFCIWLVMFLSKFVFIWALDAIFGEYININGFFGILYVVIAVTIVRKLAEVTFKKLGS